MYVLECSKPADSGGEYPWEELGRYKDRARAEIMLCCYSKIMGSVFKLNYQIALEVRVVQVVGDRREKVGMSVWI